MPTGELTMENLDILFVNPSAQAGIYQGLADSLTAIEPPLWSRLLASYMTVKGASVEILDPEASGMSAEECVDAAAALNPRLVVVVVQGHQPSASSQTMPAAIHFCQRFKAEREDIPVLVVGGHPAALPERTLEETGADAVCTGEGPITIQRFLEAIKSGITHSVSWGAVAGLCWNMPPVFINGPAPNVWNLTEKMPGGIWDKLPMDRYRAHGWHAFTNGCERKPYASIYTSLGCPWACLFCNIQNPFREGDFLKYGGKANSYRLWLPSHVVNEIQELVEKYGVTNIKIADEMFVLNKNHVGNICNEIIRRNLGDKLNLWCYARIDTLKDERLMEKMRAAGIRWCGVGIESMSEHVRDGVDKNDFTVRDIFKACERLRRQDICLAANFMFGLPDDDEKSMNETLDMIFDIMPEWLNVYCFPGDADVFTPDGIKRIDSVQSGDEVCVKGSIGIVGKSVSRLYNGQLVTIKSRYLPAVSMTPEHPVLIVPIKRSGKRNQWRGLPVINGEPRWKSAGHLVPWNDKKKRAEYDAVVVPKNLFPTIQETTVDFSPYIKARSQTGPGGQLGPVGKRYLTPWPVTPVLAEFFGWYVADGCRGGAKTNSVIICTNGQNPEEAKRVRELVRDCFGFKTYLVRRKNTNAVIVGFTSKVLRRALSEIFGASADEKRIPRFISEARKQIVEAFLAGYVAGDGTSKPNKNGQKSVISCSRALILQVMALLMKIGIMPGYCSVHTPERTIRGRVIRASTHHMAYWTGKETRYFLQDDQYYYLPIRSISESHFEGRVFNFSTTDGTYAIPFIVHNCTVAYPGTVLYRQALENGWELPDSWSGYSHHAYDYLPLRTRHLTAAEVLRFRDEAFQKFYGSPSYQSRVLTKFGPRAVVEVQEMVRVPLRRKLLGD